MRRAQDDVQADMALYPLPIARWAVGALAVLFVVVLPLTLHEYYLSIGNLVWIAVIGALGLNILVGYTGPGFDRPRRLHVGRAPTPRPIWPPGSTHRGR
jgi:hypothetical protein